MDKIKVSDSFIVSIDITESDVSVMTVSKITNQIDQSGKPVIAIVNQLFGDHAVNMYERLTNISLEGGNNNESEFN